MQASTGMRPQIAACLQSPALLTLPDRRIEEPQMAERQDGMPEPKMDAAQLYREEIITDRRVGTIRVLYPIRSDGSPDAQRTTVFVGEAQIYTNMGALPLSFE